MPSYTLNFVINYLYMGNVVIRKLIVLLCISIFFISCSSSYDFLSKNSFYPSDDFSKYLLKEYQHKADFEAKEMHDWNSAKLYSEKALKAVDGNRLEPEVISNWKIPEQHLAELEKAYDNLMKVYRTAIKTNPYDLAVAISSLDCWAEQQEENCQTWDIEDCKNDYLNAMHNIYNTINDSKKNKEDLIDNNESNPPNLTSFGTPITGLTVFDDITPGSAADKPATPIKTSASDVFI